MGLSVLGNNIALYLSLVILTFMFHIFALHGTISNIYKPQSVNSGETLFSHETCLHEMQFEV